MTVFAYASKPRGIASILILASLALALAAPACADDEDMLCSMVMLKGRKTFGGIIHEAERQLRIRISLPREPDNQNARDYDQEIDLRTLLEAVRDYYERDGLALSWKISGSAVRFVPAASATAQEKPESFEKMPGAEVPSLSEIPHVPEQPQPSPVSALPSVTEAPPAVEPSPISEIPSMPEKITAMEAPGAENRPHGVISAEASGHARGAGAMALFPLEVPEENAAPAPVSMPAFLPAKPVSSSGGNSPEITQYPEKATEFYNDAPPLLLKEHAESFLEWESRMRGAVLQGNREVLMREKDELERRMEWLEKNLR